MSVTVQDVVNVLRDGRTQLIAFSVPTPDARVTIQVDGSTFRRVAEAIENGRVTVALPPHSPPMPEGTAQYYSAFWQSPMRGPHNDFYRVAANTMRVTSVATIPARALLLHECVHASLDLTRSAAIPPAYDEAAAYVAQQLYTRASYASPWRPGPGIVHDIAVATMRVTDLIRARQPVPLPLMEAIAAAVRANDLYRDIADPDAPPYVRDG